MNKSSKFCTTEVSTCIMMTSLHSSPVCALILQQSFSLLLTDNDSFNLRGVHVDVELPAYKEAHRGCKLGLSL